MQQFRNILVCVDLTQIDEISAENIPAPSREAVKQAIWLGSQVGAELTFISTLNLTGRDSSETTSIPEQLPARLQSAVGDVHERLVAQAQAQGVTARGKLVTGKTWIELIRQVIRAQHDLVIAGTRNRSRIGQFLFGSTGMKLLRYCPCPVWLTKPDFNEDEDRVLDILIATDLTAVGQQALELGISGGQLLDARFHILHSIEHHSGLRMKFSDVPDAEVESQKTQKLAQAAQTLHEQLIQTDYRTLTWGTQQHVVDGPAHKVILGAIAKHDVDLLIMGTVARGGIPGGLIGNTAERLLPQLSCSLLAIKPDDFQCQIAVD
ncbi:MAG: universal stress protein [Planctomycetaceae bacterium]